jgi:hypothetical protein
MPPNNFENTYLTHWHAPAGHLVHPSALGAEPLPQQQPAANRVKTNNPANIAFFIAISPSLPIRAPPSGLLKQCT